MVNGFHADAVGLCHWFIPVLLRHPQPAIRRQFLDVAQDDARAQVSRKLVYSRLNLHAQFSPLHLALHGSARRTQVILVIF